MRSRLAELIALGERCGAMTLRAAALDEGFTLGGYYTVFCRDKYGNLKWDDEFDNLVTTPGKNYALESSLAASTLTTVGPFMGMIGAVSYTTGPSAADTMASHGGWTESGLANAPTYTGNRKTMTFAAASAGSKASSSTNTYAITSAGTAKGMFLALGTGAVATKDSTLGTLYSAGLFTGGDKGTLDTGDSVTATYTATA